MKIVDYNKIAWSNYFKEYIRCVRYYSDTDWYFVINEDFDNKHTRKAKSKYSYFEWI